MQSTKSEAQSTGTGQAIPINNHVCSQLHEFFSPILGPNGSSKCLIDGGSRLYISKDGITMVKNVPFSHPTASIITGAAKNLYELTGDGVSSFILQTTKIFNESFRVYMDGTPISVITEGLQVAMRNVLQFLKKTKQPLEDVQLKNLIHGILRTKLLDPGPLPEIMMRAAKACFFEGHLVELIKMDGGCLDETRFVEGLVMDHSARHCDMPKSLNDVSVLVTNISLEYEQPEIAGTLKYSTVEEQIQMAKSENEFIMERARLIAQLGRELRKDGKSLLVVSERGIDMESLNILAKEGILALRRAKKVNMERLVRICGGTLVSAVEQIKKESLGFCGEVTTVEFGESTFTLVEKVPFKNGCTILLRGSSDLQQLETCIKGCMMNVKLALKEKVCIRGGKWLYKALIDHLTYTARSARDCDVISFRILIAVYENFLKTLIRNDGGNVNSEMAIILKKGVCEKEPVYENVSVLGNVYQNSVLSAINLLLCDEIIIAGKSINKSK